MRIPAVVAALLLVVAAFHPVSAMAEGRGVVVSIKPLHSLVAGVMGDTGTPQLLVSGNVSPHEFQLKPSQAAQIGQADIIFYVDVRLETFLHHILETVPDSVRKAPLMQSRGLTLLAQRKGGAWEVHEHHAHEHHDHEEHDDILSDRHLWLDPDNAKLLVGEIAWRLSATYPLNAAVYEKNAAALITRIDALDVKLKAQLADVHTAPFIVFHDAYQYFERHYGLRAVGSITFDPEESPSPQRIQQVREKLRETGAACIFSEPYFSDKLVNTVMEGSNAQRGTLDPEATSIEAGEELYFTLMQSLADNLTHCLKKGG